MKALKAYSISNKQIWLKMNLSKKLLLFLLGQALIFALAITSFVYYYIYPTYSTLEKTTAQQSIHQIINTLSSEEDEFHEFSTTWSMWNELVDYVHTNNQEFAHTNLTSAALEPYHLNLIAIYTPTGKRIIFSRDAHSDSAILLPKFLKTMEILPPELMKINTKVSHEHHGYWGLYPLGNKIIMLSINPIYPSMPSGAPQGYIMMGRFIIQEALLQLHKATGTDFTIQSFETIPKALQQILINTPNKTVIHQTTTKMFSNIPINDIYHNANIVVSLNTNRHLFKKAQESV
jgi:sensor domain CHASE-containing protein